MSEKKEYQNIISKYLNNNYFSQTYLLSNFFLSNFKENIEDKFNEVKELYSKINHKITKEANLEREFIEPILHLLGYATNYETTRKIQGKEYQLDYLLFDTEQDKEDFRKNQEVDESTLDNVLVVSESKALGAKLDTLKIDFINNPHFQLINYLQSFKHNYGFLTNGYDWRFYDLSSNKSEKVFYEVNLKQIIEDNNIEAFKYFYHVFKKESFKKEEIKRIKQENINAKYAVEEDLKNIIYGENSVISQIGNRIYKNNKDAKIKDIFTNSVIFTFRLIFIAYFEDKFSKTLFENNQHYKQYSLKSLMEELIKLQKQEKLEENIHHINEKLSYLFDILDKGSIPLRIPLLNGGLFNQDKAKLITNDLFTNKELHSIIGSLIISNYNENEVMDFYRDFKTLSSKHIGSIYEALLEFDFKIAKEKMAYIQVKNGTNIEKEGYFDVYDVEEFKKKYKKSTILEINTYEKGDLYLSNSSHNRKSTASYYTPEEFTSFMVKEAIDNQIKNGLNILDLRIIDNACGSGHFLVEALNYVTELGVQEYNNGNNEKLKILLEEEKEKINKNIQDYKLEIEIDDFAVLKRTLLKKVIFGVDLNEFAIELTRLILWLDTFIFSTPLSFIEHHIKQGNALIGSKLTDFEKILTKDNEKSLGLFQQDILEEVNKLKEKLKTLDAISDTTKEEIEKSKDIYNSLQPDIEKLNLLLNFITYYKFYIALGKNFKYTKPNIDHLNNKDIIEAIKNSAEYEDIKEISKLYNFFNYEVEFAESFNKNKSGFNIVIGNPPWDKTKFDDKDFFSQYRSNYRKLKVSEKAKVQKSILEYSGVKEEYETKKEIIQTSNEFYKKAFPKNAGSGDSNLFRFFIEHNLSLLNKNGVLMYLTPSDIIYSDGSSALRKHIFKNYDMPFFYQFENRQGLFKDIHKSYKFAIFAIKNSNKEHDYINTKFMLHNFEDLCHENAIKYPYSLIEKIDPENNLVLEVKDELDIKIMKKMYAKFAKINESFIDFRRELDMTNDNHLFKEEYKEGYIPLYEGKMIHQFNSRFSKPTYYIDVNELKENQKPKELNRMLKAISSQLQDKKSSMLEAVLTVTNYQAKENIENIIKYDKDYYKLAFRSVARNTDERSIITAILPKNSISGNSLTISHAKTYKLVDREIKQIALPIERLLFINAIFNSLVADYIIRFMVDMNINKTYLMRLAMPQPKDEELDTNTSYKILWQNALKLTLTHNFEDFKELAEKFNIKKESLPQNQKEIDLLKIQNDIEIAKIYGLTYEELKHITSKNYFKTMNSKQKGYINLLKNKAKEELTKLNITL